VIAPFTDKFSRSYQVGIVSSPRDSLYTYQDRCVVTTLRSRWHLNCVYTLRGSLPFTSRQNTQTNKHESINHKQQQQQLYKQVHNGEDQQYHLQQRATRYVMRTCNVFVPSAKPQLSLQEKLDLAVPAEIPWDRTDRSEVQEYVRMHCHAHPRDGVFRCCDCGRENQLTHFRGAHPFKIVDCGCNHTLCSECITTEILTPVQSMSEDKRRWGNETPYYRICVCGLSHRAAATGDSLGVFEGLCECGQPIEAGKVLYYIGSYLAYRRNPEARAHKLTVESIARKMARLFPPVNPDSSEELPGLSRRGALRRKNHPYGNKTRL
jgi:hypothetical protein